MLGREGNTRRSIVPGIKQAATASPKPAKRSVGKSLPAKRPGKGASVTVTTKHAGKGKGAVVAGKRANKAASGTVLMTHRAAKGVMPFVEVTFGHVSVSVQQPTAANVKRAVTASKKVAKGLGERLVKPGVTLRHPPGVPVFTADPLDPQRVVRRLHGKVERGHFVKGQFKPEKSPA